MLQASFVSTQFHLQTQVNWLHC